MTGKLKEIRCDLCGSTHHRVLYCAPIKGKNSEDSDLSCYLASTDRYADYGRIVRCMGCGLVFTSPRLTEELIEDGYRKTEDLEYLEEAESRSINAYLCLATIKKFISSGRLLDIGCSTGYFLNAARTSFDVAGIEVSGWAADFARNQMNLNVENVSLYEDSKVLKADSFDVITAIDVIEHLHSPAVAIKKINFLLKNGGLLYIVTPNIKSFSSFIMRGKWWGLRPAHIYYFSPQTIKKILEDNGFEILLLRSYGRIFRLGYWLTRIRNYSRFFYNVIKWAMKFLHIEDKFVYINTRDSMEICARKINKVSDINGRSE